MDNRTVAKTLTDYAHTLDERGGQLYRARAYRRAAQAVLALDGELSELLAANGRKWLQEVPGIGSHLAYTIEGLVRTGEFHTWPRRPRTTAGGLARSA
jgi:DNA polymerase/3'-5' exonuclease PolX